MLKFSIASLFMLTFWLSILLPIGRASTQHQTIPTAAPTTAIIATIPITRTPINPTVTQIFPTISSTQTPTFPSQSTSVIESQTALPTSTELAGTIQSTFTATEQHATATIPILTGTFSPFEATQGSPTVAFNLSATVIPPLITPVSRGILYCLIGGGIILVLLFGIVLFARSRRK